MQRYDPNAAHGAVFSLCPGTEYCAVAASQTGQPLAGSESGDGAGAAGDYLSHLVILPAAAACGAVSVQDGANAMTVFAGGRRRGAADIGADHHFPGSEEPFRRLDGEHQGERVGDRGGGVQLMSSRGRRHLRRADLALASAGRRGRDA